MRKQYLDNDLKINQNCKILHPTDLGCSSAVKTNVTYSW